MTQRRLILALVVALASPARADKVIMKDGKIYQGHIMGETQRSLLLSNPPLDPKPRFIELKDIMTIVRESRPEEKPSLEERRFASMSAAVAGSVFSSRTFSFSPAPSLSFGGAFRVHPAAEVGGEFQLTPSLSGPSFSVTDGRTVRGYESFYAYDGGFSAKFFPFFTFNYWRAEPYLMTGFHWSRLVPKASGDALKGKSLLGGAGVMIPWWKPLYWDLRFTYEHTTYDSINFLGGEGDLSGVTLSRYSFTTGLSYRFL